MRERHIPDTRVHCVLFFINPSGHSLRPIDIQVMKKLGDIANVIPVIAKADSLTLSERELFKKRVRRITLVHSLTTRSAHRCRAMAFACTRLTTRTTMRRNVSRTLPFSRCCRLLWWVRPRCTT